MNIPIPTRRSFAMLTALAALLGVLAGCGSTSGSPAATPTATPAPAKAQTLYVASSGLKALDPATGHTLWEQSLSGPAQRAPMVSGSSVVQVSSITTSSPPHDRLDAFNAKTGAPQWHQELGFDTQAFLGVADATVFVATSAVSTTAQGAPVGVTLSALQSADGKELWRQSLTDTDIFVPIRASDGMVYLLTGSSNDTGVSYRLSAFDAHSGAPIWNKTLGGGTMLGFTSGSGGVFVSQTSGHIPAARVAQVGAPSQTSSLAAAISEDAATSASLTAYRAQDGAQLWQAVGFITVQVEKSGAVYAIQGAPQSSGAAIFTALAYDAHSGHQLWQSAQLGAGDLYQDKPTAVASSTAVYVFNAPMTAGDPHPHVYALKASSGSQIWTTSLNAHVSDSAASAAAVYAVAEQVTPTSGASTLMALQSATGATLWLIPFTGAARITLGESA